MYMHPKKHMRFYLKKKRKRKNQRLFFILRLTSYNSKLIFLFIVNHDLSTTKKNK